MAKRNGHVANQVSAQSNLTLERTPPAIRETEVSVVTPWRRWYAKQTYFNPLRDLTPDNYVRQMEQFRAGYLWRISKTWDAMAECDYLMASVIPKRKQSILRHPWELMIKPEADEAEAALHKEVLEYFFENLSVTHALDADQDGDASLLLEYMMDAQLKKFAPFEIMWEPKPQGLSARFNFVPLQFFENRTGRCRFLPFEGAMDGQELEPGGWMITVGSPLMMALGIAYIFKHQSLADWAVYCNRHGRPGMVGKTASPKDSAGWDNMVEAVQGAGAGMEIVIGMEDIVETINFAAQGNLPYPQMVELMDRSIAAILRGADLSTISAGSGQGQGASLQGKESHIIEEADARMVERTINRKIIPWVLKWNFGEGVEPLVKFNIQVPPLIDAATDLQIDEFLLASGAPLSVKNRVEYYGRTMPADDEELLVKPAAPMKGLNPNPSGQPDNGDTQPASGRVDFSANERQVAKTLVNNAAKKLSQADALVLRPLLDRLNAIVEMPNEQAFNYALRKLKGDLPSILHEVNQDPRGAEVIENAMASGFLNSLAEATVQRHR